MMRKSAELPEEMKKWPVIYPIYLDSSKTVAAGRRISKADACFEPKPQEIMELLHSMRYNVAYEPYKKYSRDFFQMGRIRYNPLDAAGNPVNPELKDRLAILRHLGKTIGAIPGRPTAADRPPLPPPTPVALRGKEDKVPEKSKKEKKKGKR